MSSRDVLAQALIMWITMRRADFYALDDASSSEGIPQETRDVAKKLAAELGASIHTAEILLHRVENGEPID